MSEAPEKIWVEKLIAHDGDHGYTAWPDAAYDGSDVAYIRADIAEARIAELEAAFDAAVQAERERCEEIVYSYLMVKTGLDVSHVVDLKAAIRKGSTHDQG